MLVTIPYGFTVFYMIIVGLHLCNELVAVALYGFLYNGPEFSERTQDSVSEFMSEPLTQRTQSCFYLKPSPNISNQVSGQTDFDFN